jgi:hypothetical protein
MRRETKKLKHGAVRTRTAFLWLPMTIYDPRREIHELRWLEAATWEEQFHEYEMARYWHPTRWL